MVLGWREYEEVLGPCCWWHWRDQRPQAPHRAAASVEVPVAREGVVQPKAGCPLSRVCASCPFCRLAGTRIDGKRFERLQMWRLYH